MVHINSDDAERRAIRHARFEIVLSLVVESLHRAARFQRVGGHITRQSGVVHLSGRLAGRRDLVHLSGRLAGRRDLVSPERPARRSDGDLVHLSGRLDGRA